MPYAIATADASTSVTNQTITINCEGLVPKAVILMATRATALNTITAGAMSSVGWTDGTTTRVAVAMSEDGQLAASADTGRQYSITKIIRTTATGDETLDGEANFVSLSNNAINISWNDFPSTAVKMVAIAFFGTYMRATTGATAASTTLNGTATVSGLAFRPAAIVHFGAVAGFAGTGAISDMRFGFVALNTDGTVQGQAGYGMRDADRPATTTQFSTIRSDYAGTRSTTAAEEAGYEVTSGTSDGFVITTRVAGTFAYAFGWIALEWGGRATVGVVKPATSSTGDKTLTGIRGKTDFLMAIGTALISNNVYSGANPCGNFSYGAAILGGSTGSIGYSAEDGAATSQTRSLTTDNSLIGVVVGAAADWNATFTASTFESSPGAADATATINVGTASPADRYLAFMAFEAPKGMDWIDARSGHRWRRCLARR